MNGSVHQVPSTSSRGAVSSMRLTLPIPLKTWDGQLQAELRQEAAVVRRLAPGLVISIPDGKPNTGPAIAASAKAWQLDRRRALLFIRHLYHALWQDGRDLSADATIERVALSAGWEPALLMEEVGVDVAPMLESWDEEWQATGHLAVPLLSRNEDHLLPGLAPSPEIERFLDDSSEAAPGAD